MCRWWGGWWDCEKGSPWPTQTWNNKDLSHSLQWTLSSICTVWGLLSPTWTSDEEESEKQGSLASTVCFPGTHESVPFHRNQCITTRGLQVPYRAGKITVTAEGIMFPWRKKDLSHTVGEASSDHLWEETQTSGSQPVCHDPYRVTYQISCMSDIYIMIHNNSSITFMK